jgi:uncharacterized protein YeaO (DUF488 family)
MIKIKRVYEEPTTSDGHRVLVDRLWPRGVTKADAALDEWNKDVAPSPELRKWFGHKPEKFELFRERYLNELEDNDAARQLQQATGTITLVYAAKDPEHNHALVLKEFLERQ